MVLSWVVLRALQAPRCWSWRWPEVLLRRCGSSPFPCLHCFFSATPFFLLLLLYCTFLSCASFFHFFQSNEPTELFLVSCGGGSNEEWLGFLVMEEFVNARLQRVGGGGARLASSSGLQLCLLALLYPSSSSMQHLASFRTSTATGLWIVDISPWQDLALTRQQCGSGAANLQGSSGDDQQGFE